MQQATNVTIETNTALNTFNVISVLSREGGELVGSAPIALSVTARL